VKIVHIEDRRENRILVRKLLEAAGHEVIDAVDGVTGIDLATSVSPDLVLVDINLPGLDGYEVVTKLRGQPALSETPIVAVTAEGDRDRAVALGFDGLIAKPIQLATFESVLRGFAAGRREHLPDAARAAHLADHGRRVVDRLEEKVRALTLANERMHELDRLKMEVLRNVSHELATPMTPLLGYVKMMEAAELGPVSDAQLRALERMRGSLSRLNGVVQNLLAATRFATGNVTLERLVTACDRVVGDALAIVAPAAEARGCEVVLVGPLPTTPGIVDPQVVRDALAQVLDNAIKFGPALGRVQLSCHLVRTTDDDAPAWEFVVTDEGPGIPIELRARVIEPFYQGDGSPTRAAGGAGLGLAIAERGAALHGGRLTIGDGSGGGARVCLQVPTRP
jgi:signal transduction histidine kinase